MRSFLTSGQVRQSSTSPPTMLCMSSPLNPHRSSNRSSSPMSSPTPMPSPLPSRRNHTRHAQPQFPRSRSAIGSTSSSAATLFPEAATEGATPVESAMWRDRFRRRCAEKQRRDTERKDEVAKRRGMLGYGQDLMEDEEEAMKRAELEDEEVGRHADYATDFSDLQTDDHPSAEKGRACEEEGIRACNWRFR